MTMSHKGFSHVGLSTLDLDKTREFSEGILGFKPVIADTIKQGRRTYPTPLLGSSDWQPSPSGCPR